MDQLVLIVELLTSGLVAAVAETSFAIHAAMTSQEESEERPTFVLGATRRGHFHNLLNNFN